MLFSVIAMNIQVPAEVLRPDPSSPPHLNYIPFGGPVVEQQKPVCLARRARRPLPPLTVIKKNDTGAGSESTSVCRN